MAIPVPLLVVFVVLAVSLVCVGFVFGFVTVVVRGVVLTGGKHGLLDASIAIGIKWKMVSYSQCVNSVVRDTINTSRTRYYTFVVKNNGFQNPPKEKKAINIHLPIVQSARKHWQRTWARTGIFLRPSNLACTVLLAQEQILQKKAVLVQCTIAVFFLQKIMIIHHSTTTHTLLPN